MQCYCEHEYHDYSLCHRPQRTQQSVVIKKQSSVHELQDLGAARLSRGSSLMKATLALIKKVADQLSEIGACRI